MQMPYVDNYGMVCSNSFILDGENKIYKKLTKYSLDFIFNKGVEQGKSGILINDFLQDTELTLADLIRFNYVIAASVLMSKKMFLDAGGFEETLGTRGEDYVLWLNVAKLKKIKYLNEPLVKYRIHSDNLSLRSFNERLEMLNRTIEIRSYFRDDKNELVRKASKTGISGIYLEMTKLFLINKNYIPARRSCMKMMKFYNNKLSFRYVKYLFYYSGILLLSLLYRR